MKPLRILLILVVLAGVVGIGVAAWFVTASRPLAFAGHGVALAAYKGPSPTGVPADYAGGADAVSRGHYLAIAADCQACHTAKGGTPFAGGLAFNLPFGTLYAPNITPDKATGIGAWTDAQFIAAVRQGKGPKAALYPAMPYAAYSQMTDADVLAVRAYLNSLAPVSYRRPPDTFGFPYNQRWLMTIWSAMFAPDQRFEPRPDRSPQWNRGAYLAEAMAHCGDCHTPRTLAQSLDNRRKYAGAEAAGWMGYNITAHRLSGLGAWSDDELAQYLATGHAEGRGSANGPMGEAVDLSFSHMTPSDIRALVAYVRSVPPVSTPDQPAPKLTAAPALPKQGVAEGVDPRGKQIFEGACASCHGWTGAGQLTPWATLTGTRAVNDASATNVAAIVIAGANRRTPTGPSVMPAFGHAYSDTEIAAVANYVTARFGASPSRVTPKQVTALRKAAS